MVPCNVPLHPLIAVLPWSAYFTQCRMVNPSGPGRIYGPMREFLSRCRQFTLCCSPLPVE